MHHCLCPTCKVWLECQEVHFHVHCEKPFECERTCPYCLQLLDERFNMKKTQDSVIQETILFCNNCQKSVRKILKVFRKVSDAQFNEEIEIQRKTVIE